MTPTATTPAARAVQKGPRAAARPRTIPSRPAPTAPRRISGPARPARARQAPPRAAAERSRIADLIRGLPDHPLLDRLVRGRAWIPVLGVMLGGIVAMQVEVLKLTASMGHSIALSNSLQSRNGVLRTSVSELSDAQRIERLASRMGMVMPSPTSVNFLHGHASAGQVAANIHPPDAAAFSSALQASLSQNTSTTPTISTTLTSSSSPTTATTPATAASTASSASTSSSTPATTTPAAAAPTGASSVATTSPAVAPAATSTPSSSGGATIGP